MYQLGFTIERESNIWWIVYDNKAKQVATIEQVLLYRIYEEMFQQSLLLKRIDQKT